MVTPKFSLVAVLSLCAATAFAAVEIKEEAGKVVVKVNGQPFTEYIFKGAPHTYFYPLLGPGGARMTRDFPMKDTEGEDHDHPHHRSLWFAHGEVNGIDFWAEPASFEGKAPKMPLGQIVHDKFLEVKSGDKEGVISSLNKWVAPDGSVPLTSIETVRILNSTGTDRTMDITETLIAGPKEVVMGDTKEGAMAIRINESMRFKPNKAKIGSGHLLSSEGKKDGDVWGTRANWVDYSGPVDGKLVGIAIFDSPSNHNHPNRWHARDYGLFALNPFANHEMDKSTPEHSGDVKIAPGQKLTYKWCIYIHEGGPEEAKVAEHWAAYAK